MFRDCYNSEQSYTYMLYPQGFSAGLAALFPKRTEQNFPKGITA
jgi:hypothetical protein